ncbi:MAG: right-handed parallel beta-helix repeat-containing protein, partial [Chloroflexota bacterium]|nr:right-handed parallel beta-helix repeat-containing protein [Chloroflexota bacterium]
MTPKHLLLALVFGLGLALTLLLVLGQAVARADPDIRLVSATGTDAGDCTVAPCQTIQYAVTVANDDGDTIRVAEGVYTETVVLTKSIILEGGWNADFSARDWETYVTTIDAQRTSTVIRVHAGISPTIEGFVITGGDSSDPLGWGGGIWVGESLNDVGLTTIRHNVVTNNVACDGSCQGHGGGILVYNNAAIIEYNTVASNTARTDSQGGEGGGIHIGWSAEAILTGNIIVSNTAVYSTTGLWEGKGGGVYLYGSDVTLVGNEIRGNVAAVKGTGRGGGLYAAGYHYNNRVLSNTASVTGTGYGGGMYAYWVQNLDDNLVQGNVASRNGDGSGGGIYAVQIQNVRGNTILANVATRGGGMYLGSYSHAEMRDNFIACNQATGSDDSVPDGGGGIVSTDDDAEIIANEIISNTAASGAGGGVLVSAGTHYILQDNLLANNTAMAGGGAAVYTATGSITRNQVISNGALFGGGMYLWGAASPALDGNIVMSNTAIGFLAPAGGGLLLNLDAGTSVTLTNHVVARNAAGPGAPGGGLVCWSGDCNLINNTIVDNNVGDYEEGVMLAGGGSHTLWNNVIVGHSVGISLTSGTATLDYNDYYDNDSDVGGATWGPHHRSDDPQFEGRAVGDYHLALNSPLVDEGDSSVNVSYDFDGDPRPRGSGIDIGADEAYRAETCVSVAIGSDITGTGSYTEPFATVTRGLTETMTGGTVAVGRGRYTERITVTRSVNLLGGYRENDWSRDIATHITTLDGEGMGTVVVILGDGVPVMQVALDGFTITGGEASLYGSGGGILVGDAAVTIRHNTITGNHAQNGGGGLAMWNDEGAESVIDSNRIYDNVADGVFPPCLLLDIKAPQSPQQGPEPGGGLLILGGPVQIVNNWIYSNTSAVGGDGIALSAWDAPAQMVHNTVADNGGAGGVGIELLGTAVDVSLYDNLVVAHGTGISGTADVQAVWDYNGFHDNIADYTPGLSGGDRGMNDVHGDPHFVDRDG